MKSIFIIITGLLAFTLVRAQEARGTPGVDYPNYLSIPETPFSCSEQKYIPGFYADLETNCQAFHYCFDNQQETFLCAVGTTFNQALLTCDTWDNSNCSLAPQFYSANAGPLLENASKNVPMLIKLRNRSQNKPTRTSTTDVYDKIKSLYKGDDSQLDGATADMKSSLEIGNELKSDEMPMDAPETDVGNESQLHEDSLSRFEAAIQNDGSAEDVRHGHFDENQEADEMLETMLYDPVTEQYYLGYGPSQDEWQRDHEDAVDPLGFYNFEDFVNKYGLAMQDYAGSSSDLEDEVSIDNLIDELHERGNEEADERGQFLRRMLDAEQKSMRVRRKPIYTVTRDDDSENPDGLEEGQHSVQESEEGTLSTEGVSTAAESSSEQPAETTTQSVETEEGDRYPPGISIEMRMPNYTPLNTSEVPLTSEEFEDAIISELVVPRIEELDLPLLATTGRRRREEDSSDFQADQFAYVEDLTPEDYESYSSEYRRDNMVISGSPEFEGEARLSEESEWYRNRETTATDDSNGNFIVIPDEYDSLDQYGETNEDPVDPIYYDPESDAQDEIEHQSGSTYDMYGRFRNLPPGSRYLKVPKGYALAYPSPFDPEVNYPRGPIRVNRFRPEGSFNPQLMSSPYAFSGESSYLEDAVTNNRFRFSHGNSPASYFPSAETRPYAYEPMNFDDYMYGTQGVYPYDYDNSYLQTMTELGYDLSELQGMSESDSNEIPHSPSIPEYYADSGVPSWFQGDSERENFEQEIGVTDGPISTEEIADLYGEGTSSPNEGMNEENIVKYEHTSDDGSIKQTETYYVLDFEDGDKTEAELQANAETSVSDDIEHPDLKSSTQTVQSSLPNESFEGDILSGIGGKSSETGRDVSLTDEFASENVVKSSDITGNIQSDINAKSSLTDTWSFQGTESSVGSEKPIVLTSTLERLAGLKSKEPTLSDSSSVYTSSNRFMNSMAFPESRFHHLPPDMARQYGKNVFSARTGNSGQPDISKLSALQDRIRSMKQGKFGAFKKYMSSSGIKN